MVVRPGRRDTSVWWPARQVGGLAWPCPSWGAWVLGGLVVWCGVLSEWCSVLGIMLLLLPWQSIQGARLSNCGRGLVVSTARLQGRILIECWGRRRMLLVRPRSLPLLFLGGAVDCQIPDARCQVPNLPNLSEVIDG